MSGEFLLYQTPDGQARIQLRMQDGTVWMTQKQLAELYQVSVPAIALHIRKVFQERELQPEATVKEYLIVAPEDARSVERRVAHYRLEMVLAIGYRVRSHRGAQFRRRATNTLRDYLVKGFLRMTEREVLTHAGKVAAEVAQAKAEAEFETFRQRELAAPSRAEQDFEAAITNPVRQIEKTRKPLRQPAKKKGGGA